MFNGEVIEILIPAEAEIAFKEFKREMESNKYLKFESKGFAMGTRVGAQAMVWEVKKGENFDEFEQFTK